MTRPWWWVAALWLAMVTVGCGSGDDDGSGSRTCGDGECSRATCETQQRCPQDCGACVGPGCEVGGAIGQCGQGCSTSCDCVNQGEVCTRDYGVSPGTCVPVDCLLCSSLERCSYSPNADGACLSPACS
jgi:hypothetical protein